VFWDYTYNEYHSQYKLNAFAGEGGRCFPPVRAWASLAANHDFYKTQHKTVVRHVAIKLNNHDFGFTDHDQDFETTERLHMDIQILKLMEN
jgi:hypothetical protein